MHLGVDFGTSNTVAVLRWSDGRARPLLFDGSPLLPSAVYAEPGGALVVGRDAVHSARLDPGRFEPNPKRRIDDSVLLLGEREVPLVEAVAAVLSRVTEELRRTAGQASVEATLTCPASWGATRRLVLADAAAAAGLGQVRLVPEPVAAATYFAQVLGRDVPIGSVVVVYDFGAGTIDASVVARTSGGFEVLAVDGRDDVGGLDVDAAVVELIGAVCAERDAAAWRRLASPSTVEERRARRLLWDDARTAKERLSRHPTADVTVPLLELDVHVTRAELEEKARPLLDQTVRLTQGVMRWAKLAEGRVAGVFLVGGSSRIPLVATLLHRALGEAPVAIEQPELVVAEGSLLAESAAVPVAAGPAPGPATAVAPAVLPPLASPVSPAARPVSPASLPVLSPAGSPAVSPVSAVPVSAVPVSGSPAPGSPVSGAPAAAAGNAAAPVASPISPVSPAAEGAAAGLAAPARSVGRVVVPGAQQPPGRAAAAAAPPAPTRHMPRYDPPTPTPTPTPTPAPPTYRPGAASYRPPARQPEPVAPPSYAAPRRSGGAGRAFRTLLLVLFLCAVPLVAGYISYKMTLHEGWLP
jgi:molecular chaperone DnaK